MPGPELTLRSFSFHDPLFKKITRNGGSGKELAVYWGAAGAGGIEKEREMQRKRGWQIGGRRERALGKKLGWG